jgi:hypothetical protein
VFEQLLLAKAAELQAPTPILAIKAHVHPRIFFTVSDMRQQMGKETQMMITRYRGLVILDLTLVLPVFGRQAKEM